MLSSPYGDLLETDNTVPAREPTVSIAAVAYACSGCDFDI